MQQLFSKCDKSSWHLVFDLYMTPKLARLPSEMTRDKSTLGLVSFKEHFLDEYEIHGCFIDKR